MNTLIAAISLPSMSTLGLWFISIAAICLVIWGVIKLIKASGLPIPEPVRIVCVVIIGLALLLIIAKMFGLVS